MPILLQFKLLRACFGNIMLLLSILLLHDNKEIELLPKKVISTTQESVWSQNSAQYHVGNLNFNCKLYRTFV